MENVAVKAGCIQSLLDGVITAVRHQ